MVRFLLAKGAKPDVGFTHLPIQVSENNDIRQMLIENGGQRTLESAMKSAIVKGSMYKVKELLMHPKIQDCDCRGLVETAASWRNPEMIKLLRSHGIPTSRRSFIYAVRKGEIDVAEAVEGDPNGSYGSMKPLHQAVRHSSKKGIAFLLNMNADPQLQDGNGRNPVKLAESIDIVRVLWPN
ncbi:hypothetical protein BGW36DRAFT_386414 [Talaromyces proteolyticus]|uniref:Ankyrin repeat protein n=1 Tax=Talaromyces proteolyticus TaxID=1131652 RepID=A0AAD4PWB6_9EURO|nr:uncharacterized protein BGW36DRAFT_386414 [Talaromyces proteolyticus]KAH8691827.1 hypothetical protein BGW36DRAFT_386414 [Talaromyces proteolyticus]